MPKANMNTKMRIDQATVQQHKVERVMNGGQSFAFRLAALNAMGGEGRTM